MFNQPEYNQVINNEIYKNMLNQAPEIIGFDSNSSQNDSSNNINYFYHPINIQNQFYQDPNQGQLYQMYQQQQYPQQFQVPQQFPQDEIFEEFDFDFSVESLNVFGCLNESIDLLDLQSNQVKENNQNKNNYNISSNNNEEDIYCDDNSTNNGSSNYSSNILEEQEFLNSQNIMNHISQRRSSVCLEKINLFSGQGVHLFFPESQEIQVSEEVYLFDDEEIVIIYNKEQLQGLLSTTRVVIMYPGKEVILRRSLSEHSDQETIASFPLNSESPLLYFLALSDMSLM